MVRLTKLIIFLVLLVSESYAKSPPPGTGTSDVPANILIMLDNSVSMRANLAVSTITYYPTDVSTDSQGNIYVMELLHNRIKVFDSTGKFLRSFGRYGWGCNQWRYAYSFEIYDDKIYVADYYGRRIKVLNLNGGCITNFSTWANYPSGVALNNNRIVVRYRDWRNQNYSKLSVYNRNTYAYIGTSTMNSSQLTYGYTLNFNNAGDKLLAGHSQSNYNYLSEFSFNGSSFSFLQQSPTTYSSSNGNFRIPYGGDYDSSGNIYASDTINHRIQKLNSSFSYISKTGSYSTTTAFRNPWGIHIDGNNKIYVNDYGNHALRIFDSNLNLTMSIGGAANTRIGAAKKVIKKIVSNTDLTSGANFGLMEWSTTRSSDTRIRVKISDKGAKTIYTNVDAVRANGYTTNLSYAMNVARNYFTSGQVPNWKKSCAQNFLIVISDGYWTNHGNVLSVADTLNKQSPSIKTFAVGFALNSPNNNYKTLAQKGGTTTPLYADNEAQLLAKLTDAIKQAISGRLTFTTPAVMSDVSRGNFIYQATFKYEKNKQWEGSLKKYPLKSDGTFGAEAWDAADVLDKKASSNRKIFTTNINLSATTNNFTTSNRSILKRLIFPNIAATDDQADKLINFIRGQDTYDQDADSNTSESIHKLADIYNSELVVVGMPEASTFNNGNANFQKTDRYYRAQNNYDTFKNSRECGGNCVNRTEVVIAGANNGILHAFKTSDGEELWGYIPPMVLGNLGRIVSSKANTTNPIYGVDGSPVVKDIFFDDTPNDNSKNPRWRTVLVSGLGAGGKGIFALDITDINNPKHLFAIENDSSNKVVRHWDSTRQRTDYVYTSGAVADPQLDYSKLGETWSTPRIIRLKVNGTDRWVAVFGGGYNQAVNPNYGSAVFVLDLENEGRLLKEVSITDKSTQNYTWTAPRVSNNHSDLSNDNKKIQIRATGNWPDMCYDSSQGESITATFTPSVGHTIFYNTTGTKVCVDYVEFDDAWPADVPGRVGFKFGSWQFKKSKNEIVNSLPADLAVITADSVADMPYDGALVYTSDLEGKITKINLMDNFRLDSNNIITNVETTTLFDAESTSDNGRYMFNKPEVTLNNEKMLWLFFGTGNAQKLQEQSTNVKNRVYGIKDDNFPLFTKVNNVGTIKRCKTGSCPTNNDLGWYVNLPNSQKVTAEATVDKDRVYFPIYEPTSGTNACKTGKAILNAYGMKCGDTLMSVNVGTGVLSKVVIAGDNLYVGISGVADTKNSNLVSKDNLIQTKSDAKASGKEVQLEYWKENY